MGCSSHAFTYAYAAEGVGTLLAAGAACLVAGKLGVNSKRARIQRVSTDVRKWQDPWAVNGTWHLSVFDWEKLQVQDVDPGEGHGRHGMPLHLDLAVRKRVPSR